MGLGLLGGGVATTNWLVKQGAVVTVTDLKTKDELAPSIRKLKSGKIKFVLGKHKEEDFVKNDIVVVGPGVPRTSKFLKIAKKNKKLIEDESTLFFQSVLNPIIAVTGTRGKTTVVNWIAHLLSARYANIKPIGNNPENPYMKAIDGLNKDCPAIVELPSWQLEILPNAKKGSFVAVITNIYPDHLNTYRDIESYVRAKANIFKYQTKKDFLILNRDNKWTNFFLAKKPKSNVLFFSKKILPKNNNGLFLRNNALFFKEGKTVKKIMETKAFVGGKGGHNLENLMASLLVVLVFEHGFKVTQAVLKNLPQVPFRQEVIFDDSKIKIINDSASTTPEAVIVAVNRFSKEGEVFLIAGGTDKNLDYGELARVIKKSKLKKLVLLSGSATDKLLSGFGRVRYKEFELFDSLEDCVKIAFSSSHRDKKIIIFSPGASSFEKFKNEFDRGRQFNQLVSKW